MTEAAGYDTAEVRLMDGKKVKLPFQRFGRTGSLSPRTTLFFYQNRWITPYEQKLRGITITLIGHIMIYLPQSLLRKELQKRDYWMSNFFPKESSWVGGYITIPVRLENDFPEKEKREEPLPLPQKED